MQDLRDSTGALASRFNILVTTQTFLGREDHRLADRLMTELPGIFNWAMDGLERLRNRGYIKDHPAGIDARDEFEQMTSPMKAFIEDWCVVDESASVPVDILWMAHNQWTKENGNRSFSKRKFIVEIKGACNGVRRDRKRLELSHLSHYYKWDTPSEDNRASVLMGNRINRMM
jgi:putative DNA primase/helicase